MDADQAEAMLGDSVAVYLDGGSLEPHEGFAESTGSTIVDATGLSDGGKLRIVRHGVIPDEEITRVVGADLVG
jgi:tRNA A37 threonylcarbamoyladenosine synthetase subunit TsaC/SUA5/YrdC